MGDLATAYTSSHMRFVRSEHMPPCEIVYLDGAFHCGWVLYAALVQIATNPCTRRGRRRNRRKDGL